MRAELRLRDFDFDNYSLELSGLVKRELSGLVEGGLVGVRNARCGCVNELARCVGDFYFPFSLSCS